jgi:hypothetical protein
MVIAAADCATRHMASNHNPICDGRAKCIAPSSDPFKAERYLYFIRRLPNRLALRRFAMGTPLDSGAFGPKMTVSINTVLLSEAKNLV